MTIINTYRTFEEMAADPGLDLGQAWCVADDQPSAAPVDEVAAWPPGWVEVGRTRDGGTFYVGLPGTQI